MKKLNLFYLICFTYFLCIFISCDYKSKHIGKWHISNIEIDTTKMQDTLNLQNFFALFFLDSFSKPINIVFNEDSIFMLNVNGETITKDHYEYFGNEKMENLKIGNKSSHFKFIDQKNAILKIDAISYRLKRD